MIDDSAEQQLDILRAGSLDAWTWFCSMQNKNCDECSDTVGCAFCNASDVCLPWDHIDNATTRQTRIECSRTKSARWLWDNNIPVYSYQIVGSCDTFAFSKEIGWILTMVTIFMATIVLPSLIVTFVRFCIHRKRMRFHQKYGS